MFNFPSVNSTDKTSRSLYLAVLAIGTVLLGLLAVLYQKTASPFSSRSLALLQTHASCAVPIRGEAATNERKQLFVSCAGFLD